MTNAPSQLASTALCIIGVLLGARLCAQEEAFVPPQAYPQDRYEEGWNKNPFTLKTAPVALQRQPFADDLVIGSYYGAKDNPTVVIVNRKTHKRWPMKKGDTAENGMTVTDVKVSSSRRETSVEVELNGEKAMLQFDDSFVREMAASNAGTETGAGRPSPDPAGMDARNRPRLTTADVTSHTATAGAADEARSSFPGSGQIADAGTGNVAASAGYIPSRGRRMKFTTPISNSHPQGPKTSQ